MLVLHASTMMGAIGASNNVCKCVQERIVAEADLNRLLGTLRYLRGLAAQRARSVQAATQQSSPAAAEQPAARANDPAGGSAGERPSCCCASPHPMPPFPAAT